MDLNSKKTKRNSVVNGYNQIEDKFIEVSLMLDRNNKIVLQEVDKNVKGYKRISK